MTKVALITDTHWGARGDSVSFADYFAKFYKEVFFPYLKENNITQIIHLGDIVDRRKYINFVTARRLREDFIKPCTDNGIKLDVIIGNHDTSFKNTNDVNSMNELYNNSNYQFNYHSDPTNIDVDGLKIAILPWVCSGNYEESMEFLENTSAQILFGHLEIQGFEMYRGAFNDHGFEANIFDKFDMVCSGHFHHKSTKGNINYLGAPYEMTWSDYNDQRGFHIFDTETRELTFIENPLKMFNKIQYNDSNWADADFIIAQDFSKLKGTYVKVIVIEKNNPYWFDMFIDKLEKTGIIDLQVVEDHLNLNLEDDADIYNEAEDTLTILRKVVESIDTNVQKKELDNLLTTLYTEALNAE
jgi:DNA repair exonuclease SbcCD nuclease subunit